MCRLIIDSHYRYADYNQYSGPEEYGCIPFLQGVWQRYATASIEAMKAGATDVLEEDLDVCDYHDHNRDEGRVVCKNKRKQSAKCECNKDSA
jgi:hypothetical protein